MKAKRYLLIPILVLSLLTQACGGNFASELSDILDASAPFLDALPLPPNIRAGLLVDFQDLARGAAMLKTDLDACTDKPCKFTAVDKYAALFETVYARGHMGADNQRLRQTVTILRALIASARLYYRTRPPSDIGGSRPVTKEDIDRQLKELKASMR